MWQKVYISDIYFLMKGRVMQTAKIFQNGRSQAIRLPKAFRLSGTEVKISRDGNRIILEPLEQSWDDWLLAIEQFSDDFMAEGRDQPAVQEREW
ncbi:antitoxin VapB [Thiothrix caldifontis]|uniref:Antitoxin VapB n=2 Tax=Thiothrix TaxID=1030 RepID=A0A1H4FDR8_9GAMM|nr:antitoxin VapB [Thiothrix caldifontis]